MKAKRKKRIYMSFRHLFVICFLFLGTSPRLLAAGSQFPNFYYYFDKKVQLDVSAETVAVCFEDTVSLEQRGAIINSEPALKDISPKRLTSRLVSLAAKEELSINDILQAVERLNKLPEVKYAAPVFKYRDKELVLTDEFVARFKSDITKQQIRQLNAEYGVEIVRASPYRHNRYVLRVINPKTGSALEVANTYNENPDVMYAAPDFMLVGGFLNYPNDTYFADQWSLHNTGQNPPSGTPDADINAPEAWDIETGSSDIIIAVLDTGVDYTHIDLSDNMWVNEAELYGDPCFDDDGNGYEDDIYGYDFFTDGPGSGEDSDPRDGDGHGTACAGIIGATGNNNEGVSGVSLNCKIMAVKIGTIRAIPSSSAAEGIDYACANGANVLNCSWGVPPNSDLTDSIINAKTNGRGGKGCVIVFASGNDNNSSIAYPAILDETITVGATDHNDERWKDVLVGDAYQGSCYGSELNVVAPSGWGTYGGVTFWTTDITGSGGYNWGSTSLGDDEGNYSKWFGGTSGSAPHVAGLAGLILSVNPYLTSNEVQEIIETTADDKGDTGWDQYYGWGRINLHKALVEVNLLRISVDDGLGPDDCMVPGDYIEYVISYSNPVTDPNASGYVGDANDVVIINHLQTEEAIPADPNAAAPLPVGMVDFIYADPNTGHYDPNDRTYTWDIGILSPGEGGTLVLVVQVNETVEPLSEIVNEVERISSEVQYSSWATEETSVCCFGGQVIYVDGSVVDANDGSSWNEAFDKLQDALTAASICDEIWVADGEYKPTTEPCDTDATFQNG